MKRMIAIAALLAAGVTMHAAAEDEVITYKGTVRGTIRQRTRTEVTVVRGGKSEIVPVNEIRMIRFDGETPQFLAARQAALRGRCDVAAERFAAIIAAGDLASDEIVEEADYYRAYCAARLALAGNGDVASAGRAIRAFVKKYSQSQHWYEATELLGRLLEAIGKPEQALAQFRQLAEAPWVDYQMRGAVAMGQALAARDQPAEAIAQFDRALELAETAEGDLVQRESFVARLGRAAALADTGETEEAISLVEAIISAADPENSALHADAYNTLGHCHREAGRDKDALLAYLHVDVLYSDRGHAHALALENLAELWTAIGQTQRAIAAQETLQRRYRVER